MKHRIALLIALVVGYCVFVFALASTLMAQRYEYRATPIETGPITVPCFVVDRFNYLCIETGDIFVNVAIGDGGWQSGHYSQRTARLSAGPNLAAEAGAKVARILTVAPLPAPRSLVSPPSPSIILAHQKIASDAWTLTAQDRDAFQQWIHDNRPACCDHRDCKPARVEWTPNGWRVEGADNLIAERDIIAWPFAVPYACIISRYARCLFLNSGG